MEMAGWNALAERVQGLSTEGFLFIFMLALLGSAFAFYYIWRSLHRARIIEDTPTARVRSAHQGYVELEGQGRLLDGPPIIAPLTGIPCLWYRYRIERRETHHDSRGRGGSHWVSVRTEISEGLFLLEDGGGHCIIDPDGAEVIPTQKDIWYGHHEYPASGPPASRRWWRLGGGDYRYTEERLMPGPLYVLGWFRTLRQDGLDLKTEVAALLRDWKGDQPTLLSRFDADLDGRISGPEWERAREQAWREVQALRSHRPSTPDNNVLGRAPSDRHPFLISAESQALLVQRYRRRARLALVATLVGVAASSWLIGVRHGLFAG